MRAGCAQITVAGHFAVHVRSLTGGHAQKAGFVRRRIVTCMHCAWVLLGATCESDYLRSDPLEQGLPHANPMEVTHSQISHVHMAHSYVYPLPTRASRARASSAGYDLSENGLCHAEFRPHPHISSAPCCPPQIKTRTIPRPPLQLRLGPSSRCGTLRCCNH